MPRPPLADNPLVALATLAVLASGEASKTERARRVGELLDREPINYEALERVVASLGTRGIGRLGISFGDVHSLELEHRLLTLRCPPADKPKLRQALLVEPAVASLWVCEGRDDFVAEVIGTDQDSVERLVQRYRPQTSLRVLERLDTIEDALRESLRLRLVSREANASSAAPLEGDA
jgi:hypothetical protein